MFTIFLISTVRLYIELVTLSYYKNCLLIVHQRWFHSRFGISMNELNEALDRFIPRTILDAKNSRFVIPINEINEALYQSIPRIILDAKS